MRELTVGEILGYINSAKEAIQKYCSRFMIMDSKDPDKAILLDRIRRSIVELLSNLDQLKDKLMKEGEGHLESRGDDQEV